MLEKKHLDIIKEVVNTGFGEAAAALSELLKARILIQVPDLRVMDAADVSDYLQNEVGNLGVKISRDFHGKIEGKSILCYSQEASRSLLEMINGERIETLSLSHADRATLQEIGNIIMVSCLSVISDIIEDRFTFDIPHVALNGHVQYFRSLMKEMAEFRQVVVVKTEMGLKESKVLGYIFILLGFRHTQTLRACYKISVALRRSGLG